MASSVMSELAVFMKRQSYIQRQGIEAGRKKKKYAYPLPSYYFPSQVYLLLAEPTVHQARQRGDAVTKGQFLGLGIGQEGGERRRQRWTSQYNAISTVHREVHVHLCWSPFWLLAEMTLFLCNNGCLHGSSNLSFRKPETFPGESIRASRAYPFPPRQKVRVCLRIEWIDNKVL